MILIRLTCIPDTKRDRGFKDENALYLNPYTVSEYRLAETRVGSAYDRETISATRVFLTNGREHPVEETPDQILGLIHLATQRKLPLSIACVDREVMIKLFAIATELEENDA
jgi:hypothetical protein